MITTYHRPNNLPAALELLATPNVLPLGSGVSLNQLKDRDFAVVDLQSLGLDKIRKHGDSLAIGAATTLQSLLESPHTPQALKTGLINEAPLNLRNMASLAGALLTADGRSPLLALMLALDARLDLAGHLAPPARLPLGEILLHRDLLSGKLITSIEIPLSTLLAYEYVARTPRDKPIVSSALARWPSGRARLVIGGWGPIPSLALDGPGLSGLATAASNAAHDATDQWAGAGYRSAIAAVLASRCLQATIQPQQAL